MILCLTVLFMSLFTQAVYDEWFLPHKDFGVHPRLRLYLQGLGLQVVKQADGATLITGTVATTDEINRCWYGRCCLTRNFMQGLQWTGLIQERSRFDLQIKPQGTRRSLKGEVTSSVQVCCLPCWFPVNSVVWQENRSR